VLLADVFVESARAHAGGEGCFAAHAVVHGVGERSIGIIIKGSWVYVRM
jgi:hypothetical protein